MTFPGNGEQYPDYYEYPQPPVENEPRRMSLPVLETAGFLMVLAAILLLARQVGVFNARPHVLPANSTVDDVSVAGMSAADAETRIRQMYATPVTVLYQDQAITLDPAVVDFTLTIDQPLAAAADASEFPQFWDFLWQRPDAPVQARTVHSYSRNKLRDWLTQVAAQYDQQVVAPGTTVVNTAAETGQAGRTLDIEASLPLVEQALLSLDNRTTALVIRDEAAPEAQEVGLIHLQEQVVQYLVQNQFKGVLSFYVIDETTGEELHMEVDLRSGTPVYLGCDVAYAGLSTMKIPIVLNYYRYLAWEPLPYEFDVVEKTLIESSNIMPNVMLSDISLISDPTRGAYAVTDSLRYLGLENTFLASAYDEEDEPEYFSTPAREAARSGACVNTNPDVYMQTTAEDIAVLLDMLYQCATHAGGDLIAAYRDDITPQECGVILDTMKRNAEGKLIRAGLPADTPLAHKHGYTYDTISDSGVVWSPGGDYVVTMFIWEDVEWVATGAYPIMMDISAITFNYFNPDLVNEPRQGYGDVLEPEN
jgi:beta-lactamase class A